MSRCKKLRNSDLLRFDAWKYDLRMLAVTDIIYGVSALLLLIIGLLRTFHYEKGWAYYKAMGAFHGKLTLFIVLGALSVMVSKKIMNWKRDARQENAQVPELRDINKVNMFLRGEMLVVVVMIGLAVLTAKP